VTETLRPATAEDVRDLVASAVERETPLELVAGASKRGLGRPVQAAVALDLSGLTGVVLYEPEELVLTARPGTPIAEIDALLTQRGQMLAFEPPDLRGLLGAGGTPSLGGAIACNLAGPRRVKAGAARDHLLGFHAVSGRAERFKSGGRVVKNVTGYDLSKLICGSYGTLAALTEVTVKVLPAAERIRTVLVYGLDDAAAIRALTQAAQSPHEPSGLAHLPQPIAARIAIDYVGSSGKAVTAIRVEGPGASVAPRTAALRALLAPYGATEELHSTRSLAFWAALRDVAPLAAGGRQVWRLHVAPGAAAGVVERIARQLDVEAFYDWAGGLVWLALAPRDDAGAAIVRAAAAPGQAILVRAAAEVRARVPVFEPQPAALAALSARVAEAFDPKRILNRGRIG
jgi:glycolate oxidase FAD binding subunit